MLIVFGFTVPDRSGLFRILVPPIVLASGHQVRCIPWVHTLWIKIISIEYILWGIHTIESTFDVANMVKTATVKDVQIKKSCASKHTGLLDSCLGKLCVHPYFVVPLISARVTLISTRVSAHCQAILLCGVKIGPNV